MVIFRHGMYGATQCEIHMLHISPMRVDFIHEEDRINGTCIRASGKQEQGRQRENKGEKQWKT